MVLDQLDKLGGDVPLARRHVPGRRRRLVQPAGTDHGATLAAGPRHQVDRLLLALVEVLLGGPGEDHGPVDAELLAEEEEMTCSLRFAKPADKNVISAVGS